MLDFGCKENDEENAQIVKKMTKSLQNDETYEQIVNTLKGVLNMEKININLEKRWVNQGTGEVIDNVGRIQTEEQISNNRKNFRHFREEILPLPGLLQQEYGNFIQTRYNPLLKAIDYDTATAFRFIYLCTYMEYDTGYIIWNNAKAKENDLKFILDISRAVMPKIKQELFDDGLIFKDTEGYLYVNPTYCYKGDISNNKEYKKEYTRIFNNSIQELYKKSGDPREHKMLGKFILLLPYVNIYHNVICLNIREKDMERIILPSSQQMDEIFHVSERNANRTLKELLSIKVGGEPAILNISHNMAKIYAVNPRIYYGGVNVKNLEELRGYFKAKGGLD